MFNLFKKSKVDRLSDEVFVLQQNSSKDNYNIGTLQQKISLLEEKVAILEHLILQQNFNEELPAYTQQQILVEDVITLDSEEEKIEKARQMLLEYSRSVIKGSDTKYVENDKIISVGK